MRKINGKFGIHAASVTLDPTIPPASKCLYSVLTIFADGKNSCFPSIETLVQVTGMSRDTIYRHLDILEKRGIIERQHKRKSGQFRNTVYILRDENRKLPYTENTDTEITVYDKNGSPCPENSDSPCPENQDTNNTIYNHTKKNTNNSAPAPQDAKPADSGEWKAPERKWEPPKKQISLEDADINTLEGYAVIKEAYKGYVRRYYSGMKITDRDIRNWWDLRKEGYDFIPTSEE